MKSYSNKMAWEKKHFWDMLGASKPSTLADLLIPSLFCLYGQRQMNRHGDLWTLQEGKVRERSFRVHRLVWTEWIKADITAVVSTYNRWPVRSHASPCVQAWGEACVECVYPDDIFAPVWQLDFSHQSQTSSAHKPANQVCRNRDKPGWFLSFQTPQRLVDGGAQQRF